MKYVYGLAPHLYTAFCLTPALAELRTAVVTGREVMQTNRGTGNKDANHFQTPEYAREWARKHGHQILNADWTPLPGTGILRPIERRSVLNG